MFLPNRLCCFEACSAKWLRHNICINFKVRTMDLCLFALIYLGKMKIRLLKYDRTMTIKVPPLNLSLWFPPICINHTVFFLSALFLIKLCYQACSNAVICGFYLRNTHSCNSPLFFFFFFHFRGKGVRREVLWNILFVLSLATSYKLS